METLPAITALVRARLTAEVEAGFPRLARTTSSDMVRLLDCLGELTSAERQALLGSWAGRGAMGLPADAGVLDAAILDSNPALRRYRDVAQSPPFTVGLRYLDLRMRKAILGDR
jgi:hypothetical protein